MLVVRSEIQGLQEGKKDSNQKCPLTYGLTSGKWRGHHDYWTRLKMQSNSFGRNHV